MRVRVDKESTVASDIESDESALIIEAVRREAEEAVRVIVEEL